MIPKISICIPVWEQYGTGLIYLNDLLNSILKQTFKEYEIVISDHSKDDKISDYVLGVMYHNYFPSVIYKRYKENYGNGVSNLNNALRLATGEIIKIIFQDDFMFHDKCLESFYKIFQNEDVNWAVCGCNHTRDGINFERYMVPSWNDKLLDGENTISSPSVLAFRNKDIELFDENLTMFMDVEYYYRLGQRYGLPTVIDDCLVTNRCHPNQISSKYRGNINDEIKYCREKYDSN